MLKCLVNNTWFGSLNIKRTTITLNMFLCQVPIFYEHLWQVSITWFPQGQSCSIYFSMYLMCTCWCSETRRPSSCVSSTLLPMLTDASSTWHRLWVEEEERIKKKAHRNKNKQKQIQIVHRWTERDAHSSLHSVHTHLANDVVLTVFLVQGQNGRNEFRNLLLQFFTGHQMAHRAHCLSYC